MKMPTADELAKVIEIENKEDWQDWQEYGGDDAEMDISFNWDFERLNNQAVLNLNTYASHNRSTGELITDKYNCGREGCFAGWYYLLGKQEEFLNEAECKTVGSYDLHALAQHFGIRYSDSRELFSSLGKGAEGFPEDVFDEEGVACADCDITREALKARGEYLDEVFQRLGVDTGRS